MREEAPECPCRTKSLFSGASVYGGPPKPAALSLPLSSYSPRSLGLRDHLNQPPSSRISQNHAETGKVMCPPCLVFGWRRWLPPRALPAPASATLYGSLSPSGPPRGQGEELHQNSLVPRLSGWQQSRLRDQSVMLPWKSGWTQLLGRTLGQQRHLVPLPRASELVSGFLEPRA